MGNLVKVASTGDVPLNKGICVQANGKNIALFNIDGKFYAIDDECSHAGGSLAEGDVTGHTVMCPLHGAEFNITTGDAESPPADEGVRAYAVVVEGDDVKIEMS